MDWSLHREREAVGRSPSRRPAPPAHSAPEALKRAAVAPRAGDVLTLQRTVGNRAVTQLLTGPQLQRTLKVSGRPVTIDERKEGQLRQFWDLSAEVIAVLRAWARDRTTPHDFADWPQAIKAATAAARQAPTPPTASGPWHPPGISSSGQPPPAQSGLPSFNSPTSRRSPPPGHDIEMEEALWGGYGSLQERFEYGGTLRGSSELWPPPELTPGAELPAAQPTAPRLSAPTSHQSLARPGQVIAGLTVETGEDIDADVLKLILQSRLYQKLAARLREEGGVRIRAHRDIQSAAMWDPTVRTIWIRPQVGAMERGGHMAFELANAYQNLTYQNVLADVRRGRIDSAEAYATACESIEYQSAQLRHEASKERMERPWPRALDPTGRHFEQDPHTYPGADALWLTFEGYLETQKMTGHWQRLVDRFARLPEREAYLKELAQEIAPVMMEIESTTETGQFGGGM